MTVATWPWTDPANGNVLGNVPLMGGAEAVRAIEAAEAALDGWRGRTAKDRAQVLRRWFELLLGTRTRPGPVDDPGTGQAAARSPG